MKLRKVTLFNGRRFTVPQGIQRIDHRATHGWQLRYGGTRLFSDGSSDGSGARASLARAVQELHARIARLPAPSRLQRAPNENKTSDLPVGISGPLVRLRAGATVRECSLSVSLPRYDQPPRRRSIYIGTENTYTAQRFKRALARAIALRPDVSAQAFTVSGLQASLRAASLTSFPTLSGTATASTASTDLTGSTFRNNSSLGLALSIPIYDQGVTAAQVAQARGNLALGVANQQAVVQSVQLNVKQTLVALVSARAALTSADAELSEAQVVLKSTQAQYRAGVTTLPLLLNAQVGLTQALTDQSTSVYALRQAEQAFLYAEGANGAP